MSAQYIYTMYKLNRAHPPDKHVLKDVSLSFLPGAKIGVLGANGSGKSTLLRIMAGRTRSTRARRSSRRARVGLLEQEPQLDPPRTCAATSKTAWPARARCWTASTSCR
jgi:ATPase subunit of ABC transporter with duplicated ATPase domains